MTDRLKEWLDEASVDADGTTEQFMALAALRAVVEECDKTRWWESPMVTKDRFLRAIEKEVLK